MKTEKFEFTCKNANSWKQGILIVVLMLLMFLCVGLAIWGSAKYELNTFLSVTLIMASGLGGATLLTMAMAHGGKVSRHESVKISIMGYHMMLIEKDNKAFEIPISAISSYSVRIHSDKLNDKEIIQWVIRYLPRKKITLSVSNTGEIDANFLAMAAARQSLATALDAATHHTIFKKPNFFASTTARVIALAVAIGFIVFTMIGIHVTGRFNINILVLIIMGCSVPFMALYSLEAENRNNYTMCNPHPKVH